MSEVAPRGTGGGAALRQRHLAAAPWPAFAMAAEASVAQLQAQAALDLWLVTLVEGEEQLVAAAAGPWAQEVGPGTVVPWAESLCIQMVNGRGPSVAPQVRAVPAYAAAAQGRSAGVGAYIGVPLLRTGDRLAGTLCGFAGSAQPDTMAEALPLVTLVGRLLSTIATREDELAEREVQVSAAQALAEQDRLTGLRTERGWAGALARETQRCRRYGLPASVLVVDVARAVAGRGDGARDAVLRRTAEVLGQASRPVDVLARSEDCSFLVLAIQCDPHATRALDRRVRTALRSAGVPASVGGASRRLGEDLADTWQRAVVAMGIDQRRWRRLEDARERRSAPLV